MSYIYRASVWEKRALEYRAAKDGVGSVMSESCCLSAVPVSSPSSCEMSSCFLFIAMAIDKEHGLVAPGNEEIVQKNMAGSFSTTRCC